MNESEQELEHLAEVNREKFLWQVLATLLDELDAASILIGVIPLDSTKSPTGIVGVRGAGDVRNPENVVTLNAAHRQELIGLSQLTVGLQNQFFVMLKNNSEKLLAELVIENRKQQLASIHAQQKAELEAKQQAHEQTCTGQEASSNAKDNAKDH